MSDDRWPGEVLVALGGNLGGERAVLARFRAAAAALSARLGCSMVRRSALYRSEPVGPVAGQPRFLNAALALTPRAPREPVAVLRTLLELEAALGRVRTGAVPQGPRAIDLDLLFVGDRVLQRSGPPPLCLPHPRLVERAFVLRPLADLKGPGWRMPGVGRTVAACLADPLVAGQALRVASAAEGLW